MILCFAWFFSRLTSGWNLWFTLQQPGRDRLNICIYHLYKMDLRYDLHAHSTCSDGTLTPAELVRHAHAQGVDVLALTDHDVTDGLAEAAMSAAVTGLTLIPGAEISVTWERQTIHIVGLGINVENTAMQQGLARLREFRHWRAQEMDRRLCKKNISGALEHVSAHARGTILSRTHFAHFLVARGYVRDNRQAFKQFLARGKPAHVPGQWAELPQAVDWIQSAGGVAVIAHPARYKLTRTKLHRLIGEFKECGGLAIEVISGSHGPDENRRFAELATTFGLLASLGSDYHGPDRSAPGTGRSRLELGRLPSLPSGCEPVWNALSR